MTLTPCSYFGVQYVLVLPRILQTLSLRTGWSIYSVHFKAVKNLTTPTSMDWLIHKRISKQRCYCKWWHKDVFCSYGTDTASALFYDKHFLKVWFGLGNAVFLLQKANACITVTERDSTTLVFLFFLARVWFLLTVLQLQHDLGTWKKTTILPSCPRPHWVSSFPKQGWIFSPTECPVDQAMG